MKLPEGHSNVLFFDGVCHLCSGLVQFLLRHDRAGRISYCPIQSALGQQAYAEQGLDAANPTTLLLVTPDGVRRESEAVLELARLLGGGWSWLRVLRLLPRGLRDALYRWVARHRYRWFGKHDACYLPRPEWQARFLA